MPELPEVETVRQGLIPALEGQRIARADLRRDGLRWPFPAGMADRLTGARVLSLARRSKYILATTDRDDTLILHLGMSGRITISGLVAPWVPGQFHHTHPQLQAHDHVVLDMDTGARVTLNDPRRFGALDLVPSAALDRHALLRDLGPEPLGNAFHAAHLAARFAGRRAPIKALLLDQRIVAGLGNIYVCEALHRAGLHPETPGGQIGQDMLDRLVTIIRQVLSDAIIAGGSTLRDYRQADGELGYFQHSFRVYGRADQPCVTPGCGGTVTRIVQSGRSSWFCPVCQPRA